MLNLPKRALAVLLVSASTALYSGGAFAMKVWDPTNYVQNLRAAISAAQTEATQALQYAQDLQQTYEMMKSTAQMVGGVANLAQMTREIRSVHQLMAVNAKLTTSMDAALSLTHNIQAGFGASNYSWDTFLQQRVNNERTRADVYRSQFEQINTSMQNTATQRAAILDKLDSAQGQTAATQALGAKLDVLIGQQQVMMSELQTKKQADEYAVRQEQANREAYDAYNRRVQSDLRESSARFLRPYAD